MNLHSSWRTGLVWAASALSAASAHADISSSAALTKFEFQLIDLAPDDGVPAGFEILPAGTTTDLSVTAFTPDDHLENGSHVEGWLTRSSAAADLGTAVSVADAGRSGLEAHGHAIGIDTAYSADAHSITSGDNGLLLAPNTQLVISARYELAASIDAVGCDSGCQNVVANVFLLSWGLSPGGPMSAGASLGLAWSDPVAQSLEDEGVLSITLSNDTALPAVDVIDAGAFATGIVLSVPPAVPEPQAALLMAAGLGALGLRRRRRVP